MYKIEISAFTPRGEFKGFLDATFASADQAVFRVQFLKDKLAVMEFLSIDVGSSEVLFPQNIIKESVFSFEVKSV